MEFGEKYITPIFYLLGETNLKHFLETSRLRWAGHVKWMLLNEHYKEMVGSRLLISLWSEETRQTIFKMDRWSR